MSRARKAVTAILIWWALEVVTLLPIMASGGASGPDMEVGLAFAAVLGVVVVGAYIGWAELMRWRDRRKALRATDS
jgi:hypothetical protein